MLRCFSWHFLLGARFLFRETGLLAYVSTKYFLSEILRNFSNRVFDISEVDLLSQFRLWGCLGVADGLQLLVPLCCGAGALLGSPSLSWSS